jgi:hypothetical protein
MRKQAWISRRDLADIMMWEEKGIKREKTEQKDEQI